MLVNLIRKTGLIFFRILHLNFLLVNLAFISYGLAVGWPSPSFLILKSEKTPLDAGPLEDDELAWINSILSMGALFGTIIFYSFSYVYGRKKLLCILTIPQIVSKIFVIWSIGIR